MTKITIITTLLSATLFTAQSITSPNFVCGDGTEILFEELCNGSPQCKDKSDESRDICFHLICPVNTFRCHYGACIDKSLICNGKNDCADGSDESQCGRNNNNSCNKDEFKCVTKECIPVGLLCDEKNDCKDGSDESENVCDDFPCPKKAHRCKTGACIKQEALCNGFSDCIDGSDEAELLCKQINCTDASCNEIKESIKCPPLIQSRIVAKCKTRKGFVSCDQPLPIGTIVHYECLNYFVPANNLHSDNKHMECQPDGTWNRKPLECKPDCGISQRSAVTLVLHGKNVEPGEWPWYSAMYALENGNYTFWCGGSLITEKAVLTAAHCTWSVTKDLLQIVVGKIITNYYEHERGAQYRSVDQIFMHPLYQDIHGNFGSDIAILVLNSSVMFSATVNAVCLDWDATEYFNHISANSTGVIVGMGINENDEISDRLKTIKLPVASNKECIKKESNDFKKYITFTAFCAGWLNGTGVCNGDSGGGLVFQKITDPKKWVLQGLVSISPRKLGTSYCDPFYYTIFTKVAIYIRWIERVLSKIHPDVDSSYSESSHNFIYPGSTHLEHLRENNE